MASTSPLDHLVLMSFESYSRAGWRGNAGADSAGALLIVRDEDIATVLFHQARHTIKKAAAEATAF